MPKPTPIKKKHPRNTRTPDTASDNISFFKKLLTPTLRSLYRYQFYIQNLLILKKAVLNAAKHNDAATQSLKAMCERACDALLYNKNSWAEIFDVEGLIGGGQIAVSSFVNDALLQSIKDDPEYKPKQHSEQDILQILKFSHSTADLCHSAMRLTCIHRVEETTALIEKTSKALKAAIQSSKNFSMMSKTCMQDAYEVRSSLLFEGYLFNLNEIQEELQTSYKKFHRLCLGGTVIGTGMNASESYRSNLYKYLNKNLSKDIEYHSHPFSLLQSNRDLFSLSSLLIQCAALLRKMGQDIRIISSGPEVGFKQWKRKHLLQGSNFFANKNNPIPEETIIQLFLYAEGRFNEVKSSFCSEELFLHVFDANAFFAVEELFTAVNAQLKIASEYSLPNIMFNPQ